MCWSNVNGNGKKASKFICLKCLNWKTIYTQDIQRLSQREKFHEKNTRCLKCGEIKGMEVRYCDYLPEIMEMAILRHNEIYNDNVTEVVEDFYGTISI